MQVGAVGSNGEANTAVNAAVNPEVWAVPGEHGKLDMELLHSTLRQLVSKKQ